MNLIKLLFKNNIPRWIIFFIDIAICSFSLFLAYLIRFNFSIPKVEVIEFPLVFGIVLIIRAVVFYFSKTYKGIVKHTSSKDSLRIFTSLTISSALFVLINIITFYGINGKFPIPFSVIIIDYMLAMFLMISTRILFKLIYTEVFSPYRERKNVIIFGAGESGIITKRALERDAGFKYKILAFIDDDETKSGKILEGTQIYHVKDLPALFEKNEIAQSIISIQNISSKRKKEIVDLCLPYKTKVLNVPPVSDWIKGELSFKQIKKIRIEELLERDPIRLDDDLIRKQISNNTILITGAAGSIGSEIVRQVIRYSPKKVILLDQAESPLYDMEMELHDNYDHNPASYEIILGDIRDKKRLERIFEEHSPQIIYHAAAYKHVPMMEYNPAEAVITNINGTKNIADLAIKYQVDRFVMISTDKAVNPTNVMGASKRIAEIYTQSLNDTSATKFITTRFGNVLGSNGSVIPRFRKQIQTGGPITVTHPEVTRFFMLIPEACQLVLEAGTHGMGGEIFIFDMGESVKIVDLAKKMVQLSGLTLDKDIEIIYTGLRPGEKLYEELLANEENTLPTHHQQILIAKVKEYNLSKVQNQIEEIIHLSRENNHKELVKQMMNLVPEFTSNIW